MITFFSGQLLSVSAGLIRFRVPLQFRVLLLLLIPAVFQRLWWAQVDSNHRPRAYQARALTT